MSAAGNSMVCSIQILRQLLSCAGVADEPIDHAEALAG
jgi:hypothetical protein